MRSLRSVESFLIVAMALAHLCMRPSIAVSQDDLTFEPYSVFVAEEEAYAYCGPAEDYYRTDPLRYGQSLDVYAETEDGWLGIRPPEDSFCWIPADTVELQESEDEGTIVEDRTVAWIGTHLGRARKYRWQVQLAKGEPVTVIGRSEREGPDGPQLWYRIVPPSGEYRWIHRDSVVMSSEELVASVRGRATHPEGTAGNSSLEGANHQSNGELQPVASSGASILNRDDAIGSGLNEQWRTQQASSEQDLSNAHAAEQHPTAFDALKRGGLLASLEFLTRPRIQEIGGEPETAPTQMTATQTAPSAADTAADSNWVSGAPRANRPQNGVANVGLGVPVVSPSTLSNNSNEIRQASAQSSVLNPSPEHSVSPAKHSFNVIPAERISQIEAEVSGADFDRLNLILSRLMAAQASAAETEPLERAAKHMANTSTDAIAVGRARMLAETAERYRRIALRRDGQSVIQTNATIATSSVDAGAMNHGTSDLRPFIPPQAPALAPTFLTPSSSIQSGTDHGNGVMEQSGYLVQVYSARSNSPPFALTDHAGRTVAYVTPVPGVNLRTHLNSRISVVGNRGYLTGLNTPHIMVTQAVRTPE